MPDYAGFLRIGKMVSVLVSVWTPGPPKPLLHTQYGLEARVGIGRLMPCFQGKTTPLYEQTQYKIPKLA